MYQALRVPSYLTGEQRELAKQASLFICYLFGLKFHVKSSILYANVLCISFDIKKTARIFKGSEVKLFKLKPKLVLMMLLIK